MKQAEYLDKCMQVLDVDTDYQLASKLEIPRMRISDYRKDKVNFDEYAYIRIGDVIGISPAVIMAEVRLEKEKKPHKALIYKNFLTAVGLWIILAVIPVSLGSFSNSVFASGSIENNVVNQTYKYIMRSCKRRYCLMRKLLKSVLFAHNRAILYV
jgi:hypothetical protein